MNNLELNLFTIEKKLDKIIRDSQLSDYEKKLHIEADIIIPLLDKIDEIEKKS